MKRRAYIVSEPAEIRCLANFLHDQLLQLLWERPMTETQLAAQMGLTRGAIGYHLNQLKEADLIYLAKLEPEKHGIMQKFYRPIATVIIVDYDRAPHDVHRHFIQKMIELLRGIFTILTRYDQLPTLTPDMLERLAVAMLQQLPRTCAGHTGENGDIEVESFKASIHAEALDTLLNRDEWRPLSDALDALAGR